MEKGKDKKVGTHAASAYEIASNAGESQVTKYQCGKDGSTGHGYVAEDFNALPDKLMGKDVQKVGMNNAKNGADRVVNGIKFQCKYCKSASETVGAAFDKSTGQYKYILRNGRPMKLEVPRDQYEDAVKFMMKRMSKGQVKGVKNPNHAYKMVKKGLVTYDQTVKIAKSGKVRGLIYDAATGTVTATHSAGISALITFCAYKWRGAKTLDALKEAGKQGAKSGGAVLATQVIVGQVLRALPQHATKKVVAEGSKAASRSVMSTIARSTARTNFVTGAVTTAVTTIPDINKARKGEITWSECGGKAAVNASSVAAGMALGAKCAIWAPPGTKIAAALIGGMLGSVGATSVGNAVKSKVSSFFKRKKK